MRAPAALLALAIVLPAVAAPSREEVAATARRNAILERKVELAKGKEFYLLLDPKASTLAMMLRGATLQTWPLQGIEVGLPRVAYVSRGAPEDWEGRVWEKGNLVPPRAIDRYELEAPPVSAEGTDVEVPIPPTPEEKYPVPPRYHIRFDGGLSIEVIPPGTKEEAGFFGGIWNGLRMWWRDAVAASSPEPEDAIRLRLVLDAKDADSLYRALPPDTKLMIVPPE